MAKATQKSSLFEGIPVVKQTEKAQVSENHKSTEGDNDNKKEIININSPSDAVNKETIRSDQLQNEKTSMPDINPQEVTGSKFSFKRVKREKKTVHKGFLITESMNDKWITLANKLNMKENQLFANDLEQLFEDQGL